MFRAPFVLHCLTWASLSLVPALAYGRAADISCDRRQPHLPLAVSNGADPRALPPGEEGDDAEAESREADPNASPDIRYTSSISDEELERLFLEDLPALGSISFGFTDEGRVINAKQLPEGDAWTRVSPDHAWGTAETIDALMAVAQAVRDTHPEAPPLRVNRISSREGGYLKPHRSHQSGRDVDLGFFYTGDLHQTRVSRNWGAHMELAYNWTLVRSLITQSDVQLVLVDQSIQKKLYDYALSIHEDQAWLDSVFSGPQRLIKHARSHRDHFHVRFYSPRAQELGRRTQPLLARRPDENRLVYRVRSGDTLGHIALRYNSTIKAIQKANGMRNTFLQLGRSLIVPMRGPCTQCPLPPPVVVPPRRVAPDPTPPPEATQTAKALETAAPGES